MVLPAFPTQSDMAELFVAFESHVHSPILGIQLVYVAMKQVVALYSQTPFKCFIAKPPERVRVHAHSMVQKAAISKLQLFFFVLLCIRETSLKEAMPLLASSKQRTPMKTLLPNHA